MGPSAAGHDPITRDWVARAERSQPPLVSLLGFVFIISKPNEHAKWVARWLNVTSLGIRWEYQSDLTVVHHCETPSLRTLPSTS